MESRWREQFREALESALPQMMTGRNAKRKSPAEKLKDLIAQADAMDKKELLGKIEEIIGEMAA